MTVPLNPQASYWPYSRNKKMLSERERMEVLMLKDIYSFAIAVLELMIGRSGVKESNIALDSLPLTWAEYNESTPLIKVLADCIQLDSITQRKGKLKSIRRTLIQEFKRFFARTFYKMEQPFFGKKADVMNKRGTVALFNRDTETAMAYWEQAKRLNDKHFDSTCNFVMYEWSTGRITDSQMMDQLSEFVFAARHKGETLEACLNIAIGNTQKGVSALESYISRTRQELQSTHIKKSKELHSVESAERMLAAI